MIDDALLIERDYKEVYVMLLIICGDILKKCANEEERKQSKLLKADFINSKIDTRNFIRFSRTC